MTVVLYPGSFDPVHNGHVEIVETAARLFDKVIVAAMRNPQKGEPLFSLEDRQSLIEESFSQLDNVEVTLFSSLVGRRLLRARQSGFWTAPPSLSAPSTWRCSIRRMRSTRGRIFSAPSMPRPSSWRVIGTSRSPLGGMS